MDLAPQAWNKVKAYGRAAIENTGQVLTATGEAIHNKAALIEANPVSTTLGRSKPVGHAAACCFWDTQKQAEADATWQRKCRP